MKPAMSVEYRAFFRCRAEEEASHQQPEGMRLRDRRRADESQRRALRSVIFTMAAHPAGRADRFHSRPPTTHKQHTTSAGGG
jgi:hypothetical protein